MHVETEIKFECSGCGQRLSVNAAGAGQTTTCPACRELLVVPQEDVVTRIATLTNAAVDWSEPEQHVSPPSEALTDEESLLKEQLVSAYAEIEQLREQLRGVEEEREKMVAGMGQLQSAHRKAEETYAELRGEMEELRRSAALQQTEIASQMQSAVELQDRLTARDAEYASLQQDLISLQEDAERLRQRASLVEPLETELGSLRKDIASSNDAQEYNKLRLRAEAAEAAQTLQFRELESVRAEMAQLSKAGAELRQQLAASNERCAAEERKVEALTDKKVEKDNEVLRAVLGRQKTELENCYRDLKRFRRAQLGLRLVYALFALGLVGVIAFALYVLPGLADFLKTL